MPPLLLAAVLAGFLGAKMPILLAMLDRASPADGRRPRFVKAAGMSTTLLAAPLPDPLSPPFSMVDVPLSVLEPAVDDDGDEDDEDDAVPAPAADDDEEEDAVMPFVFEECNGFSTTLLAVAPTAPPRLKGEEEPNGDEEEADEEGVADDEEKILEEPLVEVVEEEETTAMGGAEYADKIALVWPEPVVRRRLVGKPEPVLCFTLF